MRFNEKVNVQGRTVADPSLPVNVSVAFRYGGADYQMPSTLTWSRTARADARQLLSELIATPSPSGSEGPIGGVLERWLRRAQIPARRQRVRPQTANVIARVGRGRPHLVFCTHLDTVVADAAGWTVTQPLKPRLRGGRVYGLGACDAKGIVTALALTLRHLKKVGVPGGTITGVFVTEEETTGRGSEVFATSLRDPREAFAVIGEPAGLRRVIVGNRGSAFVSLRVEGAGHHGAYPSDQRDPLRVLPAVEAFAASLRRKYAKGAFVPSVSITSLAGGVEAIGGQIRARRLNTTPGAMDLTLDVRTSPKLDERQFFFLKREFDALARRLAPLKVRWEFLVPPVPGQRIAPRHPLVRAALAASREVTGVRATLDLTPGANDAIFFEQRGIPTLTEVGPGDPARIHRPDEFVTLAEVLQGAAFYVRLAQRVLT